MKFVFGLLLISTFLISCTENAAVDQLLSVEGPPPITEIIEVPVSLSLTIISPTANSNVGYEVQVTGTCNVPGSVVDIAGDATGLGLCGLSNTWQATVDLSALPIGAVNLDFTLTQGDVSSETVSLTLNKPSDACDDPTDRAATFATAVPPYAICTNQQLVNISTLIGGGEVSDDFILRNSLDFNGGNWSMINARMTGTFDGNGLSISNMVISSPSTDDVGIFSHGAGTIQNLTLDNIQVTGRNEVGILYGSTEGAGNVLTVTDVTITNSELNGGTYLGAIVGRVDNSTSVAISNVTSNVNISGNNDLGGLIGHIRSGATAASIAQSTVTGEVSGNQYIGGLIGIADVNNITTVSDSSYTGDIRASARYAGGLAGRFDGGSITNSHAIANVISIYDGGNEAYAGGLVGITYNTMNFDTCYHQGQISALSAQVGGLVGRFDDAGTIYDCYSGAGAIVADGTTRAVSNIGGLVGNAQESLDIQRSYNIKNITVTGTMNSSNMGGLIGYTRGLNLVDSYNTGVLNITNGDGISSGGANYGGVAGYLNPNTAFPTVTISNSNNSGNITVRSATNSVRTGGFIGYVATDNGGTQTVTISNSANTGNIDSTNQYTGGFIASSYMHRNGDTLNLSNITTSGSLTVSHYGNTPNDLYVGGISGYLNQDNNTPSTGDVNLTNLNSSMPITLSGVGTGGNYVGGIFGAMSVRRDSNATINNLTYTGGALSTPRGYLGGLMGSFYASHDTIVNMNTLTVTIPSLTSGSIQGYSAGAFGQISEANNAAVTIDNVTVTIPTQTFDNTRVGGMVGNMYLNNTSMLTVLNSAVNTDNIINTSTSEYTGGAIGRIESRSTTTLVLDNISVTGTALTSGGRYVGGFSGYLSGNGTNLPLLRNLNSNMNVTTTATNSYAGGLLGLMGGNTELELSYATGNVTIAGGGYAGGLAGGSNGGNRRVSDCYATGDVMAGAGNYVGGLIGRMYGTVENSYATGDVSTPDDYVGGLVGEMVTTTIANSFATGDVSGDEYVGGLGGDVNNPVTVTNSFAAGNVDGRTRVGGLMGYYRGPAGGVESVYTLGTVTRTSGTSNAFGEIVGDSDNDGDFVDAFFNSDTVMILGGVASPELQGNAGRGQNSAFLQNPASYPASFDFAGTNNDSWRSAVLFTLPGAGAVYPYPVLYWLEN